MLFRSEIKKKEVESLSNSPKLEKKKKKEVGCPCNPSKSKKTNEKETIFQISKNIKKNLKN